MTLNLKTPGLPVIERPNREILIDGDTMADLIEASKDSQFDLIGVTLTPSAAKKLLEINVQNRPIKPNNIDNIIDQIDRQNWGLSNDMLVVSNGKNPFLLNGQNRCTASVQSENPILVDIRFGADPKTFLSMDKGRKRTAGDDLYVYAAQRDHELLKKHAAVVAQAARFLTCYFFNDADFRLRTQSQEIIEKTYERFYPVIHHIEDARCMANEWGGSVYQYAAIRFMMGVSSESEARDFWYKVRSREALTRGTPEMEITRRFTLLKGMQNRYERGACLIIGFNQRIGAERTGRNALIEYPRYTPRTYPRIQKADGSTLTFDDFPKVIKRSIESDAA